MNKAFYLALLIVGMTMSLASCTSKVPTSHLVNIDSIQVDGPTAACITGVSGDYTIVRDSIGEDKDTVYQVHIQLPIKLVKSFETMQANATPQLILMDSVGQELVTMNMDTTQMEQLITMINGEPGDSLTLNYNVQMTKTPFLRLATARAMKLAPVDFKAKEELKEVNALIKEAQDWYELAIMCEKDVISAHGTAAEYDILDRTYSFMSTILSKIELYEIKGQVTKRQKALCEKYRALAERCK